MKKCTFLIPFFICLFLISNGQKTSTEYGFQTGLNLNSAYGSSVSKDLKGILPGLSIGAHIKINLKKQFGLKMIVAYDQYGWAYRSVYLEDNTGTALGKGDVLFKLNYLNLPVLAEYSFGNKIKFYVDAGMFFGVLLNNWLITKVNEPLSPGQVTVTKNKSAYRNSTNFGICLGFGTQIPIASKIKLNFDLRNSTGLSNINKSSSAGSSTIKTNTISILGGLSFKL